MAANLVEFLYNENNIFKDNIRRIISMDGLGKGFEGTHQY